MKKTLYILLVAGCMGLLLVTSGPALAQAEKPIVLRTADFYPPNHPIELMFKKHFMTPVEQRSKGRIKFDYYGNEALLKNFDISPGIMSGIADVGNTISSYRIWPVGSFMYLPGAFSDQEVVKFARASWPVYNKFLGRLAEPQGLKFLMGPCTSNYQIAGRGAGKKTADLGGIKIRTSGTVLPHCIKALGGTPVGMSITEAYDAMEKGVLQGISLAIPSYKAYQFQELLKWAIINVDLGSAIISYGISLKKFNSLPPDLQKILVDVGNEATDVGTETYYEDVKKDLADWKARGVELITWSAKDKDRENALLKDTWVKWITDEEKRYRPLRQMLTEWSDNLDKEGIPLSRHFKDAIKGK
ncbi:MAG: TRAP transporter substrate-binding protein DctP [Deltaproteobacteria bacterium]|nr:TRAP transporter substrate-binding protein DctP [Deltaproteobacteria bacterium]